MDIEKKTYSIKKLNLRDISVQNVWETIPVLYIGCYPWGKNDYKPKTIVRSFYTSTHLHIHFKSYENKIKITHFKMNEDVYKDSCVEFFLRPKPDHDSRYFNFEMNPIGTLLLGLGSSRYDRKRIGLYSPLKFFNISTSVTKDTISNYNKNPLDSKIQTPSDKFWTVEYSIPFIFIEKYLGKLELKSGYRFEGNFYKCGDETEYPHHGSWNPIKVGSPDFHRPNFFGNLVLE